ncbi:kinetochore protein Spc25 [Fundulus heteroclitus]|uniref:kinetochore protein Spc25 n=1 Tax=Fundulus heteroclitus TaxID=8078 RepID=UPI00165C01B1|nr:kinetochore protein Spc25 [Fundulus heteroclitus]
MESITDPTISERFASAMEEIHNKHLETYADIIDTAVELSHNHRQFVNLALDACLKKYENDEKLFETIKEIQGDLEHKKMSLKEKRRSVSEVMSAVDEKEFQKEDIIQKIQRLKEDQMKRKELIESQHRANKDRLRNIQKATLVFQTHLGLEIRPIKGEKLQFVFRNISLSDPDSTFVITIGINENGSYQFVSSDPVLECLPVLESRLLETNNLAAFLANVRKEFTSKAV